MDASPTPDLPTLLAKLQTSQPGSPEREAYLDELARRVRTGEYEADPRKIASKLLDEALRQRPSDEDDSPELERG